MIIIDEKGCTAEDFITIFIEGTDENLVRVPSGFTPNGDGSNDLLTVFGQADVTVLSFEVYARWGNLVYSNANFETNDELIGWDGRFNGEAAAGGIYYWMAEVQNQMGEIEKYKGHTTLIR